MSWLDEILGPWKGLTVTFKQMFRPKVTTRYPKEKREKPERFHGRHVLNRYADGMEKCIGCELCAGVCPADCIYVRGADNPPDDPVSPGERYGFVYEINMLRCIFCGLCVEACPTEAITMTHLFEMSVTDRDDAIFTKDELLVEPDGTPNHNQPAGPLIDLAELKLADGWMRATSPAGRAEYADVVQWSDSAGDVPDSPPVGGSTADEGSSIVSSPPDQTRPIEEPSQGGEGGQTAPSASLRSAPPPGGEETGDSPDG